MLDGDRLRSEALLQQWVDQNPQWWTMTVAAVAEAFMDFSSGFVDVLRIGQGVQQGGIGGYAKDGLRLLTIAGPLMRVVGIGARFVNINRLKVAVQVGGVEGPCTFQAINNALNIVKGRSVFLTIRDIAAALGRPLRTIARNAETGKYELFAFIDELVPFIRQFAKVKEITGLSSIQQVVKLAQQESGVVIFAIRARAVTSDLAKVKDIYHSIIAVRQASGVVRFADYGGKFVNSIDELVQNLGFLKPHGATSLYELANSAVVVEGMKLAGYAAKLQTGTVLVVPAVTAIESIEEGVDLAMSAELVASDEPAKEDAVPPEVIKGSLEAFRARKAGRPVIRLPEVVIAAGKKAAPRPDWLTGVQFRLNALGFGAGRVDGIMGPRTRSAVLEFQKAYPPLRIDGIPGPQTQSKLVEICGY